MQRRCTMTDCGSLNRCVAVITAFNGEQRSNCQTMTCDHKYCPSNCTPTPHPQTVQSFDFSVVAELHSPPAPPPNFLRAFSPNCRPASVRRRTFSSRETPTDPRDAGMMVEHSFLSMKVVAYVGSLIARGVIIHMKRVA